MCVNIIHNINNIIIIFLDKKLKQWSILINIKIKIFYCDYNYCLLNIIHLHF